MRLPLSIALIYNNSSNWILATQICLFKDVHITCDSDLTPIYQFYFLEILSDLPQAHCSIRKKLWLIHLFIKDLGEYDLEGHGNTSLIDILLKHFCLAFALASFILWLHYTGSTSYSSFLADLGDFGERGEVALTSLALFCPASSLFSATDDI